MRKVVLYSSLAGCFGLAVLLEALVTEIPEKAPGNRLVLELGGSSPRTIPEQPPESALAKTRPQEPWPGPIDQVGGGDSPGQGRQDPEAPPRTGPETWEYTVKAGDSLSAIARDQLGSGRRYRDIMLLNGLTSEDLSVDQVLLLPGAGPLANQPPPGSRDNADGWRTHVLAEGETLGEVAARYLGAATRWTEIAALNGIDDPARVRAGTLLRIPDA